MPALDQTTRLGKLKQYVVTHYVVIGAVLLSLLFVYVFAARILFGPELVTETVVQKDFVQSVVASGHVESPHRVNLGSQLNGSVLRIPVAEGQRVTAGTLLIELESSELRASLKQASMAIAQSEAKLRELRELLRPQAEQALQQAKTNFDAAHSNLLRSQRLIQQGFLNQATVDESLRAEKVTLALVKSAEHQLASLQETGSEVALANSNLEQARAAREAANARLGYTKIIAPVAGILIARNVEVGDAVQPGKILMVLSPDSATGDTQLVVQIDERNLRLLRVGQSAFASADAYPQERFPAELFYINPGIDPQRGSVEAKLKVSSPPTYLQQDMTVSVDIEVNRHPKVLLLKVDAIHDIDSATPWVLSVDHGRTSRKSIKLGLRSNSYVEILDGLLAGEQVVPTSLSAITNGMRIRAVANASATPAKDGQRQ